MRFYFIERALSPNGEVSESVISFNDSETNHCDEYWKPGTLDDKPYIMNCRTTRQNLKLLFCSSSTVVTTVLEEQNNTIV